MWPCFRSPILWRQMFAQKSHPWPDVNKAWVTFHQASSVFHNLLPLKALQDATHLLLNSVSSNTQWTPGVYLACPSPFFYFFPPAENSVRGFLWHKRRKFKFTPINALPGVAPQLHLPAEWQKNQRRLTMSKATDRLCARCLAHAFRGIFFFLNHILFPHTSSAGDKGLKYAPYDNTPR